MSTASQSWAHHLFKNPMIAVSVEPKPASACHHMALAKGGQLGVVNDITAEQRDLLDAVEANVGHCQLKNLADAMFIIVPQGGTHPQGVKDDLLSIAAPSQSVIMPLVLMMVIAVDVRGFTTKIVADTHEGRHFGDFNREGCLEFTNVLFAEGADTRVLVVLEGSQLHQMAQEFKAFTEEEYRKQAVLEPPGRAGQQQNGERAGPTFTPEGKGLWADEDGNTWPLPFKGIQAARFVQQSTFMIRIMGKERLRRVASNRLYDVSGASIRAELLERFRSGEGGTVNDDFHNDDLFKSLSYTRFVTGLKLWDDLGAFERLCHGVVTSDWAQLSLAHFGPSAGSRGVGGTAPVSVPELMELGLWLRNLEWTFMWLGGQHFHRVTESARSKLLPVQGSQYMTMSTYYLRFQLEGAIRKFVNGVRKGDSRAPAGRFLRDPVQVAAFLGTCLDDALLTNKGGPHRAYPHALWQADSVNGFLSIEHPEFGYKQGSNKRGIDPDTGLTGDGGGQDSGSGCGAKGGGGGGGGIGGAGQDNKTNKLPCAFRMMEIGKIKASNGSKVSCTATDCRECSLFPTLTKLSEVTRYDASKVAKALRKKTSSAKGTRLKGLADKFDELLAKTTWKP